MKNIKKIQKPLRYFINFFASSDDELDIRIEIDFELQLGDTVYYQSEIDDIEMEHRISNRWFNVLKNEFIFSTVPDEEYLRLKPNEVR